MTAIINGKVVTVTGETYENGTVLVEDGKNKAVGQNPRTTKRPGGGCLRLLGNARPYRLPYPHL